MIDTQLLDQFVVGSDPSAFQALVGRHGPAVLRTCESFLHDPHEAEDAMQATFLILLRRAPSIRDPETLNRWLIGVARRVSARLRKRGMVRSERERRWAEMHPEAQEIDTPLDDIRRVVREEMDYLPEVFRRPLTLCYLEGLTLQEAASRLGWPVGTLKVRLVRGRRELRDRLDRRGVALSVAFLLLSLRREASASSLTPDRVASTLRAMTLAESGDLAALKAGFPRALALARSLTRLGQPVRWGLIGAVVLTLFLASTGGAALAHRVKNENIAKAAALVRLTKVLDVDCR